ncbi:MAG: hypothetical protein IPN79_02930 [Saprospiraceae bacterium]|nr:hypothetical protein [Saprospiraceae bacterium]
MDAKVTLSFDAEVIRKAKIFAEGQNISLSRLTEFLYKKMTEKSYKSLEELDISDWVHAVAEGQAEYITRPKSRKKVRAEYFDSKK